MTMTPRCEAGEVATGSSFVGDSDPRHSGSLRHAFPIWDHPIRPCRCPRTVPPPIGYHFVAISGTQNGFFQGSVLCARPGPSS